MSVFSYTVKNILIVTLLLLYHHLTDNDIDGEALLCLTERALEQLVPVIGHRMKFLKELESLQENCPHGGNNGVETVQGDQALAQAGPSDKENDKQTSLRYTHVSCHHYTFTLTNA